MTLHVSLPKELEGMVHTHVESGMYQSASEVVREALRRFFSAADTLTTSEVDQLRTIVLPRMEAIKNGTAELIDGDEVFSSLDRMLEE